MIDTLLELGARLAARPPQGVLGWRAGQAVRNAAFVARIYAWAGLLREQAGTRFALYLADSIEFGAALLGAWQAGKTVWLSADALAASCAALDSEVDGFLGDFPAALAPLRPGPAHGAAAGVLRALDPASAALVVFTSGSTGLAQAMPKRLSQLDSEVAVLETLFGAGLGDAAIAATVSHQHIYGLLFKVLWPLAAGRALLADNTLFPEQLAALLAERPCVLVASPAHLKRLPAQLDWDGARRQLRAVFSSGGPLAREEALAGAALLGRAPLEVYGSSETGGVAWRQRAAGSDDAWQAFPNVAWRLAPDDGALEVRSPHLPDDGWLRLADRAQDGGAGRFNLLGRSDRIVKIEEKRVSLDAIEALLAGSGLAAEVRVVLGDAVPGRRQALVAFVVPSVLGRALLDQGGKLALNRRLRAALDGAVEPVARPRRWHYPDAMPLNAQGKTTRDRLLALLAPALVPAAAPAVPPAPRLPQCHVVEDGPRQVLLELRVPLTLFYFDGHFPGAPILPGVVQLDWAIHYGRRHFPALPPAFLALHALKFQHVIGPGMTVRLELVHDDVKQSLNFRYLSSAGQHASGRILFGSAALPSPVPSPLSGTESAC